MRPISSGGRPGALRKRRGSNEVGKEESRRTSPTRCRRSDANRKQGQTTATVNDRYEYIAVILKTPMNDRLLPKADIHGNKESDWFRAGFYAEIYELQLLLYYFKILRSKLAVFNLRKNDMKSLIKIIKLIVQNTINADQFYEFLHE